MRKLMTIAMMASVLMSLTFVSCKKAEDKLSEAVIEANKKMPMTQDGVTITDLSMNNDNVIMSMSIAGGEELDLEFNAAKDQLSGMLIDALADEPSTKELRKLCKEAKKGIEVRITNTDTGKAHSIVVGPDEL